MLANWKATLAKLAAIGGFIGGLLNWSAFFGIDAKTLRDQMTAHYVFLICALAFTALFAFGVYLWWQSSRVTTKNIEQKVRQWIDAFKLRHRILKDDKSHFALVVEPHTNVNVEVKRQKDRPTYLSLTNKTFTSDKQRALFDTMQDETRESVLRTIQLECARSKIRSHWDNKKFEWVCIHKDILITPDLTEARFIDSLNEVGFGALVVFNTINALLKPPS